MTEDWILCPIIPGWSYRETFTEHCHTIELDNNEADNPRCYRAVSIRFNDDDASPIAWDFLERWAAKHGATEHDA